MKIAAYCRVSTDKEDQLNSLEAQRRFFQEYAEKERDTLVKIYADEGITGTKLRNRKQFQAMMRDAEHGVFERLVVKDVSRFARNTVDLLANIRKLKALGIETLFITANMTSMGDSELLLTIMGAVAQEESANMSKRVKFGKRLNAEKGRVPNLVYGYDKTKGDLFHLTINQEEAAVIRQIYRWYLEEGHGVMKIAKLLNAQGLKTKRNTDWYPNGVAYILTNPLYTGVIVNGREEITDFLTSRRAERGEEEWLVVQQPELRIIEPEQYEAACKLMRSRHDAFHLDKERHSNKYPFSTLIKCKDCGWSFRRTSRTYKNTYVRWVCSGRNGHGAMTCPNATTVDEENLYGALQTYFQAILLEKKNIINYMVTEFEKVYRARNENELEDVQIQDRLDKLEKKRKKLTELYTNELISLEEVRPQLEELNREKRALEEKLELLSLNLTRGDQLGELLRDTFNTIEACTDVRALTNAQLKRIIQRIEVDQEGNVDIYLRLFGDLGLDEETLMALWEQTEPEEYSQGGIEPFHLSTTIHKDLSERLAAFNRPLYLQVKSVLEENKAQRHIRGGIATRKKYQER